jgi:hypothetical protein
MKHADVGWFVYLGDVAGDIFEHGLCTTAARNFGLVSLEHRDPSSNIRRKS